MYPTCARCAPGSGVVVLDERISRRRLGVSLRPLIDFGPRAQLRPMSPSSSKSDEGARAPSAHNTVLNSSTTYVEISDINILKTLRFALSI